MTDRVPGAPGQYKAVISAGELEKMQAGAQFTITMTRDDQPITAGTPYSKAAVLPDALAAAICPGVTDPTPANAFSALYTGKAPAGYGLGHAQTITLEDLDTTTRPGWYHITATTTINNVTANYWFLHVSAWGDGHLHCVQELYTISAYVTRLVRKCASGSWGAWKLENPPMITGVEYQTAEYFNGYPVYVTLVDFGLLPNNDTKQKEHKIPNISKVIRVDGSAFSETASFSLPYYTASEQGYVYANKTHVKILTTATLGTYGYSAYVAVYYTKG